MLDFLQSAVGYSIHVATWATEFAIVFLLLPSIYWRWRGFTGGTLLFFSYLVGLSCWLLSLYTCIIVMHWWTLIPLAFLGIGVLPMALLLCFLSHEVPSAAGWDMLATFATAMVMRLIGAALMTSYGIQSERRNSQLT